MSCRRCHRREAARPCGLVCAPLGRYPRRTIFRSTGTSTCVRSGNAACDGPCLRGGRSASGRTSRGTVGRPPRAPWRCAPVGCSRRGNVYRSSHSTAPDFRNPWRARSCTFADTEPLACCTSELVPWIWGDEWHRKANGAACWPQCKRPFRWPSPLAGIPLPFFWRHLHVSLLSQSLATLDYTARDSWHRSLWMRWLSGFPP